MFFGLLALSIAGCATAPPDVDPDPPHSDEDVKPDTSDTSDTSDTGDTSDTSDTSDPTLGLGDPCEEGISDCGPDAGCCTACCALAHSAVCTTLDDVGQCPLPDLTMDIASLAAAVDVQDIAFADDSCAVAEACIDGPGVRRLLRFTTTVPNTGTGDLSFGNIFDDDRFHFDECHEHPHMDGFADYELLAADGSVAGFGRKQAFCLMDNVNWGSGGGARYACDFQGISVGWADSYASYLDCQWIDVTDIAPGDYTLRVTVNAELMIRESNYDNNVAEVPVTVLDRSEQPPVTDPCATLAYSEYRDCGWEAVGDFTCTPGTQVELGCDSACLGECVGDPVLRLCDGTDPLCTGLNALAAADRAECGSWCPRIEVTCPDSGSISALTAAWDSVQAAACDVALTEL